MIELAEIEAARARIAGWVVRTPLVRLHVEDAPAEIYLKLENLQPINSFKIRGAANAVMLASASAQARGLVTASAGNMAQGIAWTARELDSMWPLVAPLVDDALAVPVAEVAAAVRTLAERVRVIAEGAGALAPAAALSGRAGTGKVVCVVSGGNINLGKLAEILGGASG